MGGTLETSTTNDTNEMITVEIPKCLLNIFRWCTLFSKIVMALLAVGCIIISPWEKDKFGQSVVFFIISSLNLILRSIEVYFFLRINNPKFFKSTLLYTLLTITGTISTLAILLRLAFYISQYEKDFDTIIYLIMAVILACSIYQNYTNFLYMKTNCYAVK